MAIKQEIIRIDGIKWWITTDTQGNRIPVPLCPQHNLRLDPKPEQYYSSSYGDFREKDSSTATKMECAEGLHILEMPRQFHKEKAYIINRVDALIFAKMITLNLDEEAIPVASEEIKKDSPYWIKVKITESKSGTRLIVWAGDRSKKNKTQLFIEPELKRLSFDQNDDHPTEVFAKVEATFSDNIQASIQEGKKEK